MNRLRWPGVVVLLIVLLAACTDEPLVPGQAFLDLPRIYDTGTYVDVVLRVNVRWNLWPEDRGAESVEVVRVASATNPEEVLTTVALTDLEFENLTARFELTDLDLTRGEEHTYVARFHWIGGVEEHETTVYIPEWTESFRDYGMGWTSQTMLAHGDGGSMALADNRFFTYDGSTWSERDYPVGFQDQFPEALLYPDGTNPVVGFVVPGYYMRFFELTGTGWLPYLEPQVDFQWIYVDAASNNSGTVSVLVIRGGLRPVVYSNDGAGWVEYVADPPLDPTHPSMDVEVDPLGKTYVALSESTWTEPVIVYEPESGWASLPILGNVPAGASTPFDLAIFPNGDPAVAWVNRDAGSVSVRRYSAGVWEPLGSDIAPAPDCPSGNCVEKVVMEISTDGTPYVSIEDEMLSNPAVYLLSGGEWVSLDRDQYGDGISGVHSTILTLAGGTTPTVGYSFARGFVLYTYKGNAP